MSKTIFNKKSFSFLDFFLITCTLLPGLLQGKLNKSTQVSSFKTQLTPTIGDNQHPFSRFNRPLKANRSSIRCFLRHTYNDLEYSRYLALNFNHILTFLSYSSETKQPRNYIRSVLKLFSQKLKASPYVNAEAFSQFLSELPELFKNYMSYNEQFTINKIKQALNTFFIENWEFFKKNPEEALHNVSGKIYDISSHSNTHEDISIQDLQFDLIRFLDLCLNKLIWSPSDQEHVWESIKIISHQLEELVTINAISSVEVLDELFWSLIHRFCYFLEVAGSELGVDTIQTINQDLNSKKLPLWTLSEQERYITPKRNHLKNALFNTYALSQARKADIITRSFDL